MTPAGPPARGRRLVLAGGVAALGAAVCGVTYVYLSSAPVSLTGQITAAHSYALNFAQPGVLSKIEVRPGQQVRAGQLLATQDTSTAASDLASAKAEAQESAATLAVEQGRHQGAPERQAVIARDKARLAAAQAHVVADQQALRNMSLTAPTAGTVIATANTTGDVVGPDGVPSSGGSSPAAGGSPVVTFVSGPLTVTTRQPGQAIRRLHIGQQATLRLSAPDRTLAGRISRITAVAARGPGAFSYDVQIAIIGHPAQLTAGQPVAITVP